MNTYPTGFYDLLERTLGASSSELLQGYLDNIMAEKYNQLQLDGFEFDPEMQIDFTYQQIQKELKMNVMATYVDPDSDAIPIGTEGFELSTGTIPRMKMVEYINEDKLRKQIIADRLLADISGDPAGNAARTALFVTLDNLIGAHTNSLTYQRHQMVSNAKLSLTDTNNPRGLKLVEFSAGVPSANTNTLSGTKRWWTNASYTTEGTAADPVGDMTAMVEAANNRGVTALHFEIEKQFAKKIMAHSKVISAIAVNQYYLASNADLATAAVSQLALDARVRILGEIVGAPIRLIDSISSVERWNKATKKLERTQIKSFNDNVVVLVPDGNIGTVKTVLPMQFSGGIYGYMYDGRLLVNVDYDYARKVQAFRTEMTSLCVPTVPQYMWYLHPYSA